MRRAGVLGSPIQHSLSPLLHRTAYRALDLSWEYNAYEVDEAGLSGFLDRLDDTWIGLSLTMPLKTTVLDLLDEVSDRAATVAAVNTVVFDQGRRTGHNTDIPGMIRALDEQDPERREVLRASVIGAGATARSALAALVERHGRNIAIDLFARDPRRAGGVIDLAEALGCPIRVRDWAEVRDAGQSDLLVSTLPGPAAAQLSVEVPQRPGLLMDVAYSPWPTALAQRWAAAGGAVATGADLLLYQAVDQVRLMTGLEPPTSQMSSALHDALERI